MKITKYQLKRIIKEEKQKLLRETVADDIDYEASIQSAVKDIVDTYVELMGETLYSEDPGAFEGRSTKDEWLDQVHNASLDLETTLEDVIRKAIDQNETMLHDGQYTRSHHDTPFGGR